MDSVYDEQLTAPIGADLVAPLTFAQTHEHYDPTRRVVVGPDGAVASASGGSSDTVHAEQEFEYFRLFRAGEQVIVRTPDGATWTKQGRRGALRFVETFRDFLDSDGKPIVRVRRVSAMKLGVGG